MLRWRVWGAHREMQAGHGSCQLADRLRDLSRARCLRVSTTVATKSTTAAAPRTIARIAWPPRPRTTARTATARRTIGLIHLKVRLVLLAEISRYCSW